MKLLYSVNLYCLPGPRDYSKLAVDFGEFVWTGGAFPGEQSIRFWCRSGSQSWSRNWEIT